MPDPKEIAAAAARIRRRKRPLTLDEYAECAVELAELVGVPQTEAFKALLDASPGRRDHGSAESSIELDVPPGDRSSVLGERLFLVAVSLPRSGGQAIQVSLSDESGHGPVRGASITVTAGGVEQTATTDVLGTATFRGVPPGVARVMATRRVSEPVVVPFVWGDFAWAASRISMFTDPRELLVADARRLGVTGAQVQLSLQDGKLFVRLFVTDWIGDRRLTEVRARVTGGSAEVTLPLLPTANPKIMAGEAAWPPGAIDLAVAFLFQ